MYGFGFERTTAVAGSHFCRSAASAPLADRPVMMECQVMKACVLLFLLLPVAAHADDRPRNYLLSVVGLPTRDTQSVKAFSFNTWGVEFKSVCHIPGGWRIKAGSSATSNGELTAEGSQGATWFNQSRPRELRAFVLVTLFAPVQRLDRTSGSGVVPATFNGYATLETDDGDQRVSLDYRNIRLTPASTCVSR